jgi:hypothetical protein
MWRSSGLLHADALERADLSGLLPWTQALSSAGIETTALDGQSGLAYIKRTPTALKSKARHAGV